MAGGRGPASPAHQLEREGPGCMKAGVPRALERAAVGVQSHMASATATQHCRYTVEAVVPGIREGVSAMSNEAFWTLTS